MGHIVDKDMKTDFKIMENNVRDLIEHTEKDFWLYQKNKIKNGIVVL